MRAVAIGWLAAALSTSLAVAAPAPPSLKDFASGAEIQALIANARAKRTTEPNYVQPLLRLAPYAANLEYRAAVGGASVHETRAELFYVVQGEANLVTGGTLVNPSRTNAENLAGSAIANGAARRVAQGDLFIVPEKTPHQFVDIDNGPIVLISMHVPRGG